MNKTRFHYNGWVYEPDPARNYQININLNRVWLIYRVSKSFFMKGTKSKVKIGNKLTKKTKASLDWDNKKCNKSTIQKIMKATDEERSLNVC